MRLKIANNRKSIIVGLGIGCVVCLLLSFGILLYAQDKTKVEFIGTKPEMDSVKKTEMDSAKIQAIMKMKEQAPARSNRFRERQSRGRIDFGENAAFYKEIIDNNLFRPLGWTPPDNEPAYSLIGTAVGADGAVSQATLLEKRSNRYHFVTIGTKLGDMTVKDIQAKQVTLDKAGKPIALKAGGLQFLATNRGRESSRGGEAGSEEEGNNNAGKNPGKQMDAEKRAQMEQKKQAAAQEKMRQEMMEKMKDASEEERREMMQQMRRQRGGGNRGGRRGGNRDR